MLSSKLAFSLASFVLILAFAMTVSTTDAAINPFTPTSTTPLVTSPNLVVGAALARASTDNSKDVLYDLRPKVGFGENPKTAQPMAPTFAGLPPGLDFVIINGSPTVRGFPTMPHPTTVYVLTAFTDEDDVDPITIEWTATVHGRPEFPARVRIEPMMFVVGLQVQDIMLPLATSFDGDATTYTFAPDLPDGIVFLSRTGELVGYPTTAQDETDYVYTAVDAGTHSADTDVTLSFRISIEENFKPTFATATIADQEYVVDEFTRVRLPYATDRSTGADLTYSFDPALPDGLTFDEEFFLLEGTPTAAQAQTEYSYKVTDNHDNVASIMFNITITGPAAPAAPMGVMDAGNGMVSWTAVAGMMYQVSTDGGTTWMDATSPYRVMGPSGTTVQVQVRVKAMGNTPAGTPSAAVPVVIPARPAAPMGVMDAGNGMVSWTAVAGMMYQVSTDGGTTWMDATSPYRVMGTGTVQVQVRVKAMGTTPAGTPSAAVPVVIPARPAAPVGVMDAGNGMVSWTAVAGMMYEVKTGTGAWMDATSPYRVMGAAGTTVQVQVRVKAMGNTPAGTPSTAIPVMIPIPPDGGTDPPVGPGMIAARGYAVLIHSGATAMETGIASGVRTIEVASMPDLWEFFLNGGTIILKGPAGSAAEHLKMTEIMAARDASLGVRGKYSQWIEVYNRTAADINFRASGWMLEFRQGGVSPLPAVASASGAGRVDLVSNMDNPGYWAIHSTGGRTMATAEANAVPLVSMYRKLKELNNTGHADHAKDDGNPERAGTWVASKRPSRNLSGERLGTPGAPPTWHTPLPTRPTQEVVINEIGNSGTDAYDWVELRNTTENEINLKKWELSIVRAVDGQPRDMQLVSFPDNNATKLPAKGILVITHSDPTDSGNDLEAGFEINKAAADRVNRGVSSFYYIDNNLVLPNNNSSYTLILRNANDKEGKPEKIVDVSGTYFAEKDDGATFDTEVWPLHTWQRGHGDVIEGDAPEDFRAGFVYKRKGGVGKAAQDGVGEHHWQRVGFTGIGYDRGAAKSDENGGTPGYANDALKEKVADLASGAEISISEIMVDAGSGRRSLPQWIELYNASMTQAVNLNGWKLEFQNVMDEALDARVSAKITLGAVTLAPNQTVLIVSTSGANSGRDHFPDTRMIDLWTDHRDALGMAARTDTVLSAAGFYLKLTDKDNKLVDEVGNKKAGRKDDTLDWELPMGSADGPRASLIRRYDAKMAEDGTMESGWISASQTTLSAEGFSEQTYYGDKEDLGTPGHHGGGPLPVSLSSFRPARDTATGAVVIRWSTESELNNAGFNILRSESKTGAFKVVNVKGMIVGHGTTSEKHVYTWTDTSAKPDVLYYYQIEDVALDGTRTTLRTTHLRGNVTAAGKAATTWGQLKSQQ